MSEPTGDLRDQIADAIRTHLRITTGPQALADLTAGRPIPLSGAEADDAAAAVLRVVEPEILRAQVDTTERADTLTARLEQAEADAKSARLNVQDWHEVAEAREKRAEQAEADRDRYKALAEGLQIELRDAIQAQGEAEPAFERVRALAQAAKDAEAQSLSRQFGSAPWPASVPADDVLAALDDQARPAARGAQTKETP